MKNFFAFATLLLVVSLIPTGLEAQDKSTSNDLKLDLKSSAVNFQVRLSPTSANPGDNVTVEIEANVVEGWHIYPIQKSYVVPIWLPTRIEFDPVGLEPTSEEFECSVAPTKKTMGNESQLCLSGKFVWRRSYRIKKDSKSFGGSGSIEFQVCNDEKCLPPETLKFDMGKTATMRAAVKSRYKPIGKPIEVNLEPCKLERPKARLSISAILLSSGKPIDKLTLKGTLNLSENKSVDLYLPRERKFRIENTSNDNTRFANKSTYVSVDHDGNGIITEAENYPSNLPIRIGGNMFKIVDLNKKEKRLTIQQIDHPLFGTILGKSCPPFEYVSLDGNMISNKSILGKVTILDIWAVT